MPLNLKLNIGGANYPVSGWTNQATGAGFFPESDGSLDYIGVVGENPDLNGQANLPPTRVIGSIAYFQSGNATSATLTGLTAGKDYTLRLTFWMPATLADGQNNYAYSFPVKLDGVTKATVTGTSTKVYVIEFLFTAASSSAVLQLAANTVGSKKAISAIEIIEYVETVPPTGAITSHTNGQTVLGSITVSGTCSDNVGVTSVQPKIDGANSGSPITGTALTSFSKTFDTTLLTNGNHTFSFLLSDEAGNTTTVSVSLNVDNPVIIGATWTYDQFQKPFYHSDPEEDWDAVTREHEYEDGGKSFNELSDTPPITWTLIYDGIDARYTSIAKSLDQHFSTYRKSRVFTLINKFGTYQNVRYKSYEKVHSGNQSWIKERRITFVLYP